MSMSCTAVALVDSGDDGSVIGSMSPSKRISRRDRRESVEQTAGRVEVVANRRDPDRVEHPEKAHGAVVRRDRSATEIEPPLAIAARDAGTVQIEVTDVLDTPSRQGAPPIPRPKPERPRMAALVTMPTDAHRSLGTPGKSEKRSSRCSERKLRRVRMPRKARDRDEDVTSGARSVSRTGRSCDAMDLPRHPGDDPP
jgi:hypothetical protein